MAILTQGWDHDTRKPKLVVPPGSCDTHIHLFGPEAKFPFASDSPYTSRDALPEELFKLQDTLGFATAVVVSPGGYGRNTAMLEDALKRYPDRLRGIALIRDDTPSAEIARLGSLGVKGIDRKSVV